ncbi:MAG: YggT family protein [Actinomycetota bacterium]
MGFDFRFLLVGTPDRAFPGAIGAYRYILFLYIILSFLQSLAGLTLPDVIRPAARFVYDVSEPFLRIFRGLLPALRLGGMGLDLSPIIAFIVLLIAERVLIEVLF